MQCPHWLVAFRDIWHRSFINYDNGRASKWECITTVCPECHNPSIKIRQLLSTGVDVVDVMGKAFLQDQWVFPHSRRGKHFGDEVPDDLKSDYFEACEVLAISPRSSATLSRRIVETVLRHQGYRQSTLSLQIKAVREESDSDKKLPTTLLKIVDAVRQFGNFSAHQAKSMTTLQIIEVEPGEAKLCLEIVEGLFEHYYVRPDMEAKKLETVNRRMLELVVDQV